LEFSKLTEEEVIEQYTLLNKYLITVNEKIIPKEIYLKAFELCKDEDPNDTIFIALSLYLNAKFWSGDVKLLKHLNKKGFNNIIRTNDLFNSL
jgi:predicted nucleic acid-binding protein